MAAIQVKPTRMELSNLKKRKKVAVRGHKMMKDKRDELVRRFIEYARKNKVLRAEVEEKLSRAMKSFVLARASMSNAEVEEALIYPARAAEVSAGIQHVLSIQVPQLGIQTQDGFTYPYGFVTTSADLDLSVQLHGGVGRPSPNAQQPGRQPTPGGTPNRIEGEKQIYLQPSGWIAALSVRP